MSKEDTKTTGTGWSIILSAILLLIATACAAGTAQKTAVPTDPKKSVEKSTPENDGPSTAKIPQCPDTPNMSLFLEAYGLIRQYGYNNQKITDEALLEGAIRGMLSATDKYSHYEGATDASLEKDRYDGRFGGIGIASEYKDGTLNIREVFPNSPAEKAGIRIRDEILEIDGERVGDLGDSGSILKIRGDKGTSVKLKIRHQGQKEAVTVTVTRGEIKIREVEYRLIRNQGRRLAYIRVKSFTEATVVGFREAALRLRFRWGADGIILDLRGNSGGLVRVARQLAGAWIGTERTAYIELGPTIRKPVSGERLPHATPSMGNIPTVVLIDGDSASASEILAGALRDHQKAVIVGEMSYGKGTVQMPFTLKNHGVLNLTIRHWLTPKGLSVDGKGIKPDITVGRAKPDGNGAVADPQLDEAIRTLLQQAGKRPKKTKNQKSPLP